MRTLYDLAGRDEGVRFSPYCWRTRMALAHKGLEVRTVPWRFTEKDVISFAGTDRVPVLVDDDVVIADSEAIADHLEARYPLAPLFGSPQARALARFVRHWVESIVMPGITRQIGVDIVRMLHPRDVDYFERTRATRLGMSLQSFCADRDQRLPEFRDSLRPLRLAVAVQPFLHGDTPGYADYIAFGAFQWARCASPRELLDAGDAVLAWRERMLLLHGGLGANAPRAS